jgi:hypothetical protein
MSTAPPTAARRGPRSAGRVGGFRRRGRRAHPAAQAPRSSRSRVDLVRHLRGRLVRERAIFVARDLPDGRRLGARGDVDGGRPTRLLARGWYNLTGAVDLRRRQAPSLQGLASAVHGYGARSEIVVDRLRHEPFTRTSTTSSTSIDGVRRVRQWDLQGTLSGATFSWTNLNAEASRRSSSSASRSTRPSKSTAGCGTAARRRTRPRVRRGRRRGGRRILRDRLVRRRDRVQVRLGDPARRPAVPPAGRASGHGGLLGLRRLHPGRPDLVHRASRARHPTRHRRCIPGQVRLPEHRRRRVGWSAISRSSGPASTRSSTFTARGTSSFGRSGQPRRTGRFGSPGTTERTGRTRPLLRSPTTPRCPIARRRGSPRTGPTAAGRSSSTPAGTGAARSLATCSGRSMAVRRGPTSRERSPTSRCSPSPRISSI